MSYLFLSRRTAAYLAARAGLDQEKEVVLAFIIEVFVLNFGNLLLTLLLGMLLGVLPGTVACIAVAALFRHTAGGAHSKSPWRCAAVTITVFPAMALLASRLSALEQIYTNILSAAAVLIGFVSVIILAPVDTPSAPVISPVRRRNLKVLSIFAFTIITIAIVVFRQGVWSDAREIQLCLVLSLLWASFNLSKPGHRFMSFVDGIKIQKRGGD
jgi:accessory gene regulator B